MGCLIIGGLVLFVVGVANLIQKDWVVGTILIVVGGGTWFVCYLYLICRIAAIFDPKLSGRCF
jgi:hypothetical protein